MKEVHGSRKRGAEEMVMTMSRLAGSEEENEQKDNEEYFLQCGFV